MATERTAFNRFFDQWKKEPKYAAKYEKKVTHVKEVDRLVNELDALRIRMGLSKLELAQRIDVNPSAVRRLFTAEDSNPRLGTFIKFLHGLGHRLTIVRATKGR